jgi:hypothetical protein
MSPKSCEHGGTLSDDHFSKNFRKKKFYFVIIKVVKNYNKLRKMEYLRREEFEFTVIKEVLSFVDRHCKNKSDFNKKEEVEAKIDLFFGQNPNISRVATEIGLATKTKQEKTELLLRTTLEFAYNNYKVDIERKQQEILSLRRELRVAQQKSRSSVASITKRESETRAKERMIMKKNLKLEKLNKENGGLRKQVAILKKENSKQLKEQIDKAENQVTKSGKNKRKKKDKKFSEKRSANDERFLHQGFSHLKMEMYIYDILKKYEGADLEAIIKSFGKVSSYEVKRLHKYQLIKAEIHLAHEWKRKVLENGWPYTTVSYKGEILNLRHVFTTTKKAEVDEKWKRTGIIKIPGYVGKKDDIQAIIEYLKEKKTLVPFVYGKNIIIQGELYFWAIFLTDERVNDAREISKKEGIDNGWEILTNLKIALQKKEKGTKNLLSTVPTENQEKTKNKEKMTTTKSQLRKEYEANMTEIQKPKEDEVVEIVGKFRKGVLDVDAKEFKPQQHSE